MFSLFLKKTKKLYIARDIPGEKPLYYTRKNNKLYFASEAKALKQILDLKPTKDKFFDTFQHCLDRTLWKDVYQLPAAHYIEYNTISKNFRSSNIGKLKIEKYTKKKQVKN